MKKLLLVIISCSIVYILYSCKKVELPCSLALPSETTSGKNTFGCYINDELWVAYIDETGAFIGGEKKIEADFDENTNAANINANKEIQLSNCDTISQSFSLLVFDVIQGDTTRIISTSRYNDFIKGCTYQINNEATNKVIITKVDTEENFISGIFNFEMTSLDCLDTLRITDGRFDIKYTF